MGSLPARQPKQTIRSNNACSTRTAENRDPTHPLRVQSSGAEQNKISVLMRHPACRHRVPTPISSNLLLISPSSCILSLVAASVPAGYCLLYTPHHWSTVLDILLQPSPTPIPARRFHRRIYHVSSSVARENQLIADGPLSISYRLQNYKYINGGMHGQYSGFGLLIWHACRLAENAPNGAHQLSLCE
jgi:hypothetical protein